MKKSVLFLLALGFVAFTSCKKDYTCVCDITTDNGSTVTQSSESETIHEKEDDAKVECAAESGSATAGSVTVTKVCAIQ